MSDTTYLRVKKSDMPLVSLVAGKLSHVAERRMTQPEVISTLYRVFERMPTSVLEKHLKELRN